MNSRNNIELDNTFGKLADRNVKDLYWLLFSSCPINQAHPILKKVPFFPIDIIEDWRESAADYFIRLDQRPQELHHFLDRPKNKRLGFYAEALLSFFFQTFSEIELLLQNYQIIDQKITLGELDFVIKWKGRVLHIECAVKFYLCNHAKDVDDLHSWIGPACKDDLGRKIKKVKEQQLPMINSSVVEEELEHDKIESYLFLKGKMYVNQEVLCEWVNSEFLERYYKRSELDSEKDLKLLTKPYWMSSVIEKTQAKHSKSFKVDNFSKRAELVSQTGSHPFFIVPENWPF